MKLNIDMSFLKSRKLWILIISIVFFSLNSWYNFMSDTAAKELLAVISAWIIGQGIADHGAQGASIAAQRAMKQGESVASAVVAVLSKGKGKVEEKKKEG